MKIINVTQGTPEWLEARKGRVTGSRFKDARDRLKNGDPSKACLNYAKDVARERCGGKAPEAFQNAAMRFGTEQEPLARAAYEQHTGNIVHEVGFIVDDEGYFGLSPDGLIGDDGVLEIKTMVSSDTLFTALADGDISEYIDQCNGYLWLLGLKWVDLVLWAPDLQAMKIIRIERDENAIEALESDLMKFAQKVGEFESKLRKELASLKTEAAPQELPATNQILELAAA